MLGLNIVIPLPASLKKNLTRFCCGLPFVEWTEEENLHIILRSINLIEGTLTIDIKECLEKITFTPFSLTLQSITLHPFKRSQGTLLIEVSPSEELKKLKIQIDKALNELKLPQTAPFKPHIKLGKYQRTPPEKLAQYLEGHAFFYMPSFEVQTIQLLTMQKTPKHIIFQLEGEYGNSLS